MFTYLIFYLSDTQNPCSLLFLFLYAIMNSCCGTRPTDQFAVYLCFIKKDQTTEEWSSFVMCPYLNFNSNNNKKNNPDVSRHFSKYKGITVTFRVGCLLMGFWHNECLTEISNHTLLINSPFLEPPSVSRNCQPFERASIISYTFIYLLTAAAWASSNKDKVAAAGLITIKLFSHVSVFMCAHR